jgi:DNA-binding response OmpR family regulator
MPPRGVLTKLLQSDQGQQLVSEIHGHSKPKALLVEDEFLVSIAVQEMLSRLGFDVVGPAYTVGEARRLLDSSTFNIAVLDVHISGEMIWPVAHELVRRSLPFLFVTGDVAIGAQTPVGLANVRVLFKPFNETQLAMAVGGVLREENNHSSWTHSLVAVASLASVIAL